MLLYAVLYAVYTLCSLYAVQGQRLFLGGGGIDDNNYELWDKVVEMAGGSNARIGVVTAASADPLDSWNFYGPLFVDRGAAETYWVPVHLGNLDAAYDPEVVANIHRMTGFFFGGGDQARIIESFHTSERDPTPALTAIRDNYNETSDCLIGGSSAGTVATVKGPMIMGGYSWESLIYGAYEWTAPSIPDWTVTYDGQGGLGFLDNFIVDSHYSERGREGRLTRLVYDTAGLPLGVPYGLGIDENTAVLVYGANTPTGYAEVIGEAGAMIVDTTETTLDTSGEYPRLDGVVMHYITPGDRLDLATLDVTYGPDKANIVGQEDLSFAPTSVEVFDGAVKPNQPPEFTNCATGLFDASDDVTTEGVTWEGSPEYTVRFDKTDPRAEGYKVPENGGDISYSYLVVSMYETGTARGAPHQHREGRALYDDGL